MQFKANLEDPWQVLTEERSGIGGTIEMEIDELGERGFYRIRLKL